MGRIGNGTQNDGGAFPSVKEDEMWEQDRMTKWKRGWIAGRLIDNKAGEEGEDQSVFGACSEQACYGLL